MARLKRAQALLFVALAACTAAVSAPKATIRIGALYPLSGSLAHYGNEELRGVTIAVVYEDDPYGSSVGDGIRREAAARGFRLAGSFPYDPAHETFAGIIRSLQRLRPDVLVAASYLHDGALFRQAIVKAKLPIKAMIGKCAAFYTPEMAKLLGSQIDGVFVADKPMDLAPSALDPAGRALETEFVARYRSRFAGTPEAAAYMGFSGAWALFEGALSH